MVDPNTGNRIAAEHESYMQDRLNDLKAENAALRQQLNTLSIGVRNACTILGGEIFLAEYDKPRLYEPTVKVHDYLRKLVDAVDKVMGENDVQGK